LLYAGGNSIAMKPKAANKTREAILAHALRLFNDSGTAAVSTNHIAEAAGISPGNLYYHFRNKEEIIRVLFEQRSVEASAMGGFQDEHAPSLDDVRLIARESLELNWKYRFIFRELIVLLRRDDALRDHWTQVRKRGFDGFQQLLMAFVDAGVLRSPADKAEGVRLAELCWLVAELWMPGLEIAGHKVSASQINRGVDLMMHVLGPYIAQPERA
jgi:AcrR family transcriptional regulator